jgi:hypothetical protein
MGFDQIKRKPESDGKRARGLRTEGGGERERKRERERETE